MNLPRLLENWSSSTLTLNTSIVNMFGSVFATNQFQLPYGSMNPTGYYEAPSNRKFTFDSRLLSRQPPGTPNLNVVARNGWATPPPGKVNYYVTP